MAAEARGLDMADESHDEVGPAAIPLGAYSSFDDDHSGSEPASGNSVHFLGTANHD
jgi:hypothetical protein